MMIPAIGSSLPAFDAGAAAPVAPGTVSPAARAAAGAGFAAMMSEVAASAMGAMRAAETASIEGVRGSAPTQAVVDAVMEAERTLQTAVAVRDKVVAAYLELSRMAI